MNINNIINVALLAEGKAVARDNMNVCVLLTTEQGVLSSNERFRIYSDSSSVEQDFGALTETTKNAYKFFGTSPNAVNFGGVLVIGYHRNKRENVEALPTTLKGSEIDWDRTLNEFLYVDKGGFEITLGEDIISYSPLDFRSFLTKEEIVKYLNDTNASSPLIFRTVGERILVEAKDKDSTAEISFAKPTDNGASQFIGGLLGLEEGSGAEIVPNKPAEVLEPEEVLTAMSILKSQVNFKGIATINKIPNKDVVVVGEWAKSNAVIVYETFSGSVYLEVEQDNPVWQVKLAGLTNMRCLYSKSNNRGLGVSYMARAHTVNFAAENSAMTMNLKTLSVPSEDFTTTEITKANRVGLDIYTVVKDVPVVKTSDANDFVDNVYNIIAFIDAVQTDMFNLLKATSTKIPQTERGLKQLLDQGEKTSEQFVTAGVFAPGIWTSPDSFGNLETFLKNIKTNGYYWWSTGFDVQPRDERQRRKSPPLQCAAKNAGAVHNVDILINFNY